ncbi:MAG: 30S ribosomal protein S18 [Actinobacteria bacterium]|nr:30S ribosomal protein S18 [Actinomycetota bacterium]
MAGKNAKLRGKNKDNSRRAKKKVSILTSEKVEYIDYKDIELLQRFTSDRAKIRARRVTGNDSQQQAAIAMAIKNAREMALLPYASRVTQQRSNRGERGERSQRADGPPPTPSAPPPGGEGSLDDDVSTEELVFAEEVAAGSIDVDGED